MSRFLVAALMFCVGAVSAAEEGPGVKVTRSGSQPTATGPADNFTGLARVDGPFQGTSPARVSGATVTFEPGARTAWHTHPLGQTLIVTSGTGSVQHWNGPRQEIKQGDNVWIPPGVKHWHGASATTSMVHVAIAESLDEKVVDWMEKVSDAQYGLPTTPAQGKSAQQTPAQRMYGDISPKFAQLTDDVLYADVWERPGLSKRDRSLATISALIAMNRPDQLRSHIGRARDNGVTQEEIIESITHLAFYAGWPSAVTAISVAKEVFQKTPAK
jgi:4-carboxymuconolactone decarboxylase